MNILTGSSVTVNGNDYTVVSIKRTYVLLKVTSPSGTSTRQVTFRECEELFGV